MLERETTWTTQFIEEKSMGSKNHAFVQVALIGALLRYIAKFTILSELTLDLKPQPLTPDICIYPKINPNWFQDEIKVATMPLTVIEIISPTQGSYLFSEKMMIYFENGVQSCWLVEPMLRTIAIFMPDKNSHVYSVGQLVDPVTNITITLNEIFV
jgi:Uma2 family endonuclease